MFKKKIFHQNWVSDWSGTLFWRGVEFSVLSLCLIKCRHTFFLISLAEKKGVGCGESRRLKDITEFSASILFFFKWALLSREVGRKWNRRTSTSSVHVTLKNFFGFLATIPHCSCWFKTFKCFLNPHSFSSCCAVIVNLFTFLYMVSTF